MGKPMSEKKIRLSRDTSTPAGRELWEAVRMATEQQAKPEALTTDQVREIIAMGLIDHAHKEYLALTCDGERPDAVDAANAIMRQLGLLPPAEEVAGE
jgi:hypothetical protein